MKLLMVRGIGTSHNGGWGWEGTTANDGMVWQVVKKHSHPNGTITLTLLLINVLLTLQEVASQIETH